MSRDPAALLWSSLGLLAVLLPVSSLEGAEPSRPNFLFAIADDWGWPHAGAYGDPVVQTPVFDRAAREGVLFRNAYVSSPSCTPSRGAILTGQYHWRLEGAANLWSIFPDRLVTYPEILEKAGYVTGTTGKAWGPGRTETPGRDLSGQRHPSFAAFLDTVPPGKPFCFWLGSGDPHRPYVRGTGEKSGIKLDEVRLPACFPDHPSVRGDVADYYFEVQRFDRLVGAALERLAQAGQLDNTVVVITGDHGMPFPRCKANLYDTGTRVPLAIRWPGLGKPGRVVDNFVSLTDVAPTFLELAGLKRPAEMTGRSLVKILASATGGQVEQERDHVLTGKERHVPIQEAPDPGGYPCRALRTQDYLYIRNFTPQRWPNGTPHHEKAFLKGAWYADCDNGPTKTYMIESRDRDEQHRRLYELAFGKRPAEELYDLKKDPDQLVNVAADPAYAQAKKELARWLLAGLKASADPRAVGGAEELERHPYLGSAPRHPSLERKKP